MSLNRLSLFVVGATLILTPALSSEPSPAGKSGPKIYAVIFGVTIGKDSEVLNVRVERVMDPSTGSKDPVKVDVPPEYVAAVTKLLVEKRYEPQFKDGVPVEFFTYVFFDPAYPSRVITKVNHK